MMPGRRQSASRRSRPSTASASTTSAWCRSQERCWRGWGTKVDTQRSRATLVAEMDLDLSPRHFRLLLDELDIPNREVADLCGVAESSLYRWLKGESPIPASAVRMFLLMKTLRSLSQVIAAAPMGAEGGAQ